MTLHPSIRPAVLADVEALRRLVEGAYRGESSRRGWTHEADLLDGQRTDAAMLTDVIGDPDQKILVAETMDALVGCVQISRKSIDTAYLGMLTVDPTWQTQGLGKFLIVEAERFASQQLGARWMEMTVIRQRDSLIDYYRRRGYAATGEERPFPVEDARFGLPRRRDLSFVVLNKQL